MDWRFSLGLRAISLKLLGKYFQTACGGCFAVSQVAARRGGVIERQDAKSNPIWRSTLDTKAQRHTELARCLCASVSKGIALLDVDSHRIRRLTVHRYNQIGLAQPAEIRGERDINLVETRVLGLSTCIEHGHAEAAYGARHVLQRGAPFYPSAI